MAIMAQLHRHLQKSIIINFSRSVKYHNSSQQQQLQQLQQQQLLLQHLRPVHRHKPRLQHIKIIHIPVVVLVGQDGLKLLHIHIAVQAMTQKLPQLPTLTDFSAM